MSLELPYWFVVSVAVALGLAWGSFLNVVIYRLPRGQSVAFPGSRCASCGTPLRAIDNVPVLSWVFLRGRAHCCQARISVRYPIIEAIGGLAGYAVCDHVYSVIGPDAAPLALLGHFACLLALSLGLIALIFIDLEYMILPDEITLGGAVLGVLTAQFRHVGWLESLGGALFGFVLVWLPFVYLYKKWRGVPGMGLGDAKLLLLAGAWFGYRGVLFALTAGAVQGTVAALVVLLVKGRIDEPEAVKQEREELRLHLETLEGEARAELERELAEDPLANEPDDGIGKARLPFGPFLALATLEYLFVGQTLVDGYLAVIGVGA